MKKKIVALFAMGVFSLCAVFAQAGGTQNEVVVLTVEQAVDYAMENSKTLKSNDIDLAIKERASKYAWNVLLPTVQVTGTAARTTDISSTLQSANSSVQMANTFGQMMALMPGGTGTFTPAEPMEETEKLHWALVGNVSAQLNLSLAYIYQIKAAKASYEGGKITWEQSQKQTIMNIKKLFYGLLIQQESLNIQKTSLDNAKNRADQAAINFNNGRIPQLQLLNAQVTYQNQIPEYETANRNLRQQLDTFAFLLGLPVGTEIKLEGSIEPEYVDVSAEELLEKYGSNNMDIASLQNNIDVLNMNLKALNLSSFTPALSLSYNYQPTGSWFSGDLEWSDRGSFSATLAWNLTNILPFSKNRQQAKELKDNLKKLELTMDTLKENQKVQVRKAVDTLNQAREQIDSMSRTVDLAQRSYDMSARMYANGMTQLLDLNESANQLRQAKLGLLSQQYQYISALMDLEYELNTDLSEYKIK